ncbi:methylenetetrahydrofolate reductase [Grus japonensis]|uniref:Methylenetetrahydrofolate reductase n=1 Tax=Grus japonensis TaxID=30415 RepID=A0ABC9Y1F4_GRUJA
MIWMMGQSVPSANLLMTQNWKECLIGPEGHAAIQRNFNRLEKWANRNLMQFNKGKSKVLHLGRNNPRHQYMLGATQLENRFPEKALEGLVYPKLNVRQHCALVAKKGHGIWAALG